ncbi:MAG: PAS domain-containing protein [Burkholderiales bacterium]|jgi:two-component system nitrogen regulation sensor histidine kinase GlnL|nr:PAS domain-containing protein [Burkholderiales bacterium]
MNTAALNGLDLLATAVVVVDDKQAVLYMNPAAENLFEASNTHVSGLTLERLFGDNAVLASAISYAHANNCSYTEHELEFAVNGRLRLNLACTVSPTERGSAAGGTLLEFRQIDQQLRVEREARLLEQSQAHRELIRNLAHEIKNPLGGIRGAAQLLDRELERPALHEYTQVIIKESDRLQSLMDRLLTPHRLPLPGPVNIHEVLERVRSVILAEFPGIIVRRDYDTSMPVLTGDREQLIQVVLNITRNAAQAIKSVGKEGGDNSASGEIRLKTRIARQVTLARRRFRHAVQVEISDNGPGIPEIMRSRVFQPLISGREGGSGLGLTIAHNFVTQHHGAITFESAPGKTCFTLLLPVQDDPRATRNTER